ncbi:MAG: group II intron maturase-specific domain-containing protein [Gammaproteobacteria bacterium]
MYQLNSKLREWAYYYRHVCSKRPFSYINHQLFRKDILIKVIVG